MVAQQAATSEILQVISQSPTDVGPVFEAIVSAAVRLFRCDLAFFLRCYGATFSQAALVGPDGSPIPLDPSVLPVDPELNFPSRTFVSGKNLHLPDWSAIDLPEHERRIHETYGIYSSLFLPLLLQGGECVGLLALASTRPRVFGEGEIALAESFRDQAVIAIQNTRLFNETKEALEQQKASADILSVISNSVADPQPVFDEILRSIEHLFGADERFVFLAGQDGLLHIGAVHGPNAERARSLFPVPLEGSASEVAIRERRLVTHANVFDDTDVPPILRETAHRFGKNYSMAVAPMLWEDRAVGSIFVGRTSMEPFGDRECGLLRSFADQAVIAIQNARLFEQVKSKSRDLEESLQQQTATADVLRIISRSVAHAAPVFDTILESCQRLFNPYDAAVYLVEGNVVRGVARRGAGVGEWGTDSMPLEGSSTGAAIAQRRPIHFPDLADKADLPEDKRAFVKEIGGMTVLYAPMISQDSGVGSLVVTRRPAKPFTEAEVGLIQTFADQAVIAIENARLFDEVQAKTRDVEESLQQQTATADVLKVISRSAFDLHSVFDTLARSAADLCAVNLCGLHILEGDFLVCRGYDGGSKEQQEFVRQARIPVNDTNYAMTRVLSSGEIANIANFDDATATTRTFQKILGFKALLMVPLMREGQGIGLFVLGRDRVGEFSPRHIELVQTFADQAVIAIENVRLFNETKEALERQTATADMLKVIASSPSDTQPVFDAIAESSNRLLRGRTTTVLRFIDEHVHLVAFTRTDPVADAMLQGYFPLPVHESQYFAIAKKGAPTQVFDTEESSSPRLRDIARARGYRSQLYAPLMDNGLPVGVIVVTRAEPGAFANRDIELLQTFADQALIAISNVELFKQVQQRTRELSQSLDDLRAAQDRLVQTEKLASLGQLTAGIAHEIKNPLNFVNNFAALSTELTDELNETLAPAPLDQKIRDDVDELTGMLKSNLEKVVQHGKRADSIVKNMLQHSREGSGERSFQDLNALVSESLNLAFHGARAERSDFNITLKQNLDAAAGAVEVYPQELTRALLNLISNGFYAAIMRKTEANGDSFEPMLTAATKVASDAVEIRIRDNGTGIPAEIRQKIFNPFFTTKPTGEGTGLGLSMVHDIIVKQHGGRIDVETEPGAFTEFIITLPRGNGTAGSPGPG
jgi:two-component system NtrC family sensor kinase